MSRTLSDEDVEAIAEAVAPKVKDALVTDFYQDLGKGVWGLVWRGAIAILLAIAVYGATLGGWLKKLTPPA